MSRTDVLATGGFGCILYPALSIGSVITDDIADQYVTKIARDAEDEYDIATYVARLLPDAGVYPVDLICGITRATVPADVFERINQKCQDILKSEKRGYADKDPVFGAAAQREFETRRASRVETSRAMSSTVARVGNTTFPYAGATFSPWCAVQYPKYVSSLFAFVEQPRDRGLKFTPQARAAAANGMVARLCDLHRNGIFHNDVKSENFAVVTENVKSQVLDVKFADWGSLTIIVPNFLFKCVRLGVPTETAARQLQTELNEFYQTDFKRKVRGRVEYFKRLMAPVMHKPYDMCIQMLDESYSTKDILVIARSMVMAMTVTDLYCTLTAVLDMLLCGKRDRQLEILLLNSCNFFIDNIWNDLPLVFDEPFLNTDDINRYSQIFAAASGIYQTINIELTPSVPSSIRLDKSTLVTRS